MRWAYRWLQLLWRSHPGSPWTAIWTLKCDRRAWTDPIRCVGTIDDPLTDPPGSRLLELPEVRALVGALDEAALVYPWSNPAQRSTGSICRLGACAARRHSANDQIFGDIWRLAHELAGILSIRACKKRSRHAGSAQRAVVLLRRTTEEQFAI